MVIEQNIMPCPRCKSKNTKKAGKKYNAETIKQRYQCNDCRRVYT